MERSRQSTTKSSNRLYYLLTRFQDFMSVKEGLKLSSYAILGIMKLALKIRPQRSTQYANMAAELAIPELLASPLASALSAVTPTTLAGQGYLLAELGEAQLASPDQMQILAR